MAFLFLVGVANVSLWYGGTLGSAGLVTGLFMDATFVVAAIIYWLRWPAAWVIGEGAIGVRSPSGRMTTVRPTAVRSIRMSAKGTSVELVTASTTWQADYHWLMDNTALLDLLEALATTEARSALEPPIRTIVECRALARQAQAAGSSAMALTAARDAAYRGRFAQARRRYRTAIRSGVALEPADQSLLECLERAPLPYESGGNS